MGCKASNVSSLVLSRELTPGLDVRCWRREGEEQFEGEPRFLMLVPVAETETPGEGKGAV